MTSTFLSRLTAGQVSEQLLREYLTPLGFNVMETGQETLLPKQVHTALRYEHSDPMVRAVRYHPDLLVYHPNFPLAYWEVKTNTTPGTPNFAVETACYQEALARNQKGERVVFAFLEVDGTWHANWVQHLQVMHDMGAKRKQANGSGTPYLLITKISTLPLQYFLDQECRRISGMTGIRPTI